MTCDTCQSGPLANYYSVDGISFCPDCYTEPRYEGCPSCNAGLEATTGCCFQCDDLRAGITRAEADLTEARALARNYWELYAGFDPVCESDPDIYPWLSETE